MKKTYDKPIIAVTRFEVDDELTQNVSFIPPEPGVDDWDPNPTV